MQTAFPKPEVDPSYISQKNALLCTTRLEQAGMGAPGMPNTLVDMVEEITAKYAALKRDLFKTRDLIQTELSHAKHHYGDEEAYAHLTRLDEAIDTMRAQGTDDHTE